MMQAALLLVAVITASGDRAAAPAPAWRKSAAAYVRGLVRAPKRLLERVDPARGLVIARSLSCEVEKPRETFTHACGAKVDRAAGPGLRSLVEMLRRNPPNADGPGVTCKTSPRATCVVPPTSECEIEITIVFAAPSDGAPVIAIIERDDWQSDVFYRRPTNRRIEALLARQAADGCDELAAF